jgi:hypothetical protein
MCLAAVVKIVTLFTTKSEQYPLIPERELPGGRLKQQQIINALEHIMGTGHTIANQSCLLNGLSGKIEYVSLR